MSSALQSCTAGNVETHISSATPSTQTQTRDPSKASSKEDEAYYTEHVRQIPVATKVHSTFQDIYTGA